MLSYSHPGNTHTRKFYTEYQGPNSNGNQWKLTLTSEGKETQVQFSLPLG